MLVTLKIQFSSPFSLLCKPYSPPFSLNQSINQINQLNKLFSSYKLHKPYNTNIHNVFSHSHHQRKQDCRNCDTCITHCRGPIVADIYHLARCSENRLRDGKGWAQAHWQSCERQACGWNQPGLYAKSFLPFCLCSFFLSVSFFTTSYIHVTLTN